MWVACLQKEPCGSTREAWPAGVWGTQDRIKLDAVMKGPNTSRSETSLGTSLKENRGDNYYLYWVNSQFSDIAKGVWLYYRMQIQSDFFQCKEVIFATFHCIEETISNFVHLFLVSIFWNFRLHGAWTKRRLAETICFKSMTQDFIPTVS